MNRVITRSEYWARISHAIILALTIGTVCIVAHILSVNHQQKESSETQSSNSRH